MILIIRHLHLICNFSKRVYNVGVKLCAAVIFQFLQCNFRVHSFSVAPGGSHSARGDIVSLHRVREAF